MSLMSAPDSMVLKGKVKGPYAGLSGYERESELA